MKSNCNRSTFWAREKKSDSRREVRWTMIQRGSNGRGNTKDVKQAFKWQPTSARNSNAIKVEEQYENHATFKCSLCNCKDLRASQKGWSEPPLTNRGCPDKLTKTESETQGTEARGKGIHYSLHWITHNCQLQRNCFLCSYNLTNPIAIHTIAIQSQHTLCQRL